MSESFIAGKDILVLLLLIVVILLCIVTLAWVIPHLRKSKSSNDHKQKVPFLKPRVSAEEQFSNSLRKQHLLLENRLTAWNRAAGTYKPGVGGDFDFHALEEPLRPARLFDVHELVSEYQKLASHKDAPRIAAALMAINHDFAELGTRTKIIGQNFRNQYEYATQLFGFYVFQLTQLNDQFGQHVKENRVKSELLHFATSYMKIFDDWTASGVDKSIQELHRDLVIRIVYLNYQFPRNPVYKQIDEYTSKCEEAYEIIEGLDRKIKELDLDGRIVIANALRVVRCLSGLPPFKKAAGLSMDPFASYMPKATQSSGSHSTQPVNFSDWAKSTLERTKQEQENLSNRTKPKSPNDPPAENALGKRPFKAHRSTWLGLSAIVLFLSIAGYFWMKYRNQKSTPEGSYAGISHPPVDSVNRIHTLNYHHALLKPQLDSVHRASKIDSLKSLLSNPDRDSTEILALAEHIDSLKLGHKQADLPNLYYGIDVSVYQGQVDWSGVAVDSSGPNPIHFAILRATHGLKIDNQFKGNWVNSKKFIPTVGAYHFLSFLHDPIQQANLFIQTVPLGLGNMRPILDVETNCKDCDPTMGLTKDELIQHIKDYLRVVEAHYETKAIIYSNVHYYNTYLKGHFPEHDFWLAEYRGAQGIKKVVQSHQNPPDQEIAVMWQFSSTGKIKGINPKHNVDLNFLQGTFAERIKISRATMLSRE